MSAPDSVFIPAEALREKAALALARHRVAGENARAVAEMLTAAEIDGQRGHGLRRLAAYAAQAQAGKVDGFAVPAVEKIRPACAVVDARSGFAAPAMLSAVCAAAELAAEQGVACVGVFNSHHAGQMGRWAAMLAARGVVGLAFSNSPAAMAAWGGKRPLLGTNPISFAVPRPQKAEALVADLSLSRMARGKMMAAAQTGESIPAGMALDAGGAPTTNAEAALAGSLLPAGEAKGYALALLVEILCAPLAGGSLSLDASSFFNAEGSPPHIGQFLIAIAPARADFGEKLERLLLELESEPGVRLPGAGLPARRLRAAERGVEISAVLRDEIESLARENVL